MCAAAATPVLARHYRPNRKADRIFFTGMPVLLWATVLFGFTKTYFGAGMVMAPLPNLLIHIHGAAFTLWMVLLVVQTTLISTHHVKWHMKLGVAGFCLSVLMVVLGTLAAVDALRRGRGPLGLDSVTFFVIPISSMVVFSVLVFFAYRLRRVAEAHKRLIILATIAIMDAAVGRWPVALLQQHPPTQDLVILAFLLLMVMYDLFSLHRLSKYTMWASLFIVVVHLGRVPLGHSAPWHAVVKHLL
jgi:hypothetical protein